MDFLVANLSIVLALIIYGFLHAYHKWIHKHNTWFFLGGLLLSLIVIFIEIPILNTLVNRGHLSLSLFMLVMFSGAFKRQWIVYKKILLVRGDLAILGFVFLLPHGIERLSLALNGYQSTGLIAAIIMIPLTLSSFMIVRKKMPPKLWKNLHKLAYIAYLMIYVHIGFTLSINPSNFYILLNDYSIIFHLIFVIYLILKINRLITRKQTV